MADKNNGAQPDNPSLPRRQGRRETRKPACARPAASRLRSPRRVRRIPGVCHAPASALHDLVAAGQPTGIQPCESFEGWHAAGIRRRAQRSLADAEAVKPEPVTISGGFRAMAAGSGCNLDAST